MTKQKQATWDDIRALADGGLTANQIASRLNKADLTTPAGKRWYDSSVLFHVRQQMDKADLKKELPQLARDAAKYDAKQADKKKKARATTKARAAAVDAAPSQQVLIPSTRSAMPLQSSETATPAPAPLRTRCYAHVVIWNDGETGHARVDLYDDMDQALRALCATDGDYDGADVNRILPIDDVAELLATNRVTRVSRRI